MGLSDLAGEAMKALVPPKTNELEPQQRWRWTVFLSIILLWTVVGGQIALSYGWVSSVHPGFALATDTQAIQRRVDVIATLSLEHEIRNKASELCVEKSPDRRRELNDDIAKLQREYHEIAAQWYNIPRCDQL